MTISSISNGEQGSSVRTKLNAAITQLNGLGTASTEAATAFATAAQGSTADTAVQPGDLAAVATSGAYDDLVDAPVMVAADNPAITSGGGLVLDCGGAVNSYHVVTLDQDLTAGGISIIGLPTATVANLTVEFRQDGNGPWDIPVTAWSGISGLVFDTAYAVYTDTTPTRFWLQTLDGGTTWSAACNSELAGFQYRQIDGVSDDITADDDRKTLCCTSGATVTLTADSSIAAGFQCRIVAEGAGGVIVETEGGDTIAALTSPPLIDAGYGALLYQRTEGAWMLVPGI